MRSGSLLCHPGKGARCPGPGDGTGGAHRGVARGAVGTVDVVVLQLQGLPEFPSLTDPVQGIGMSPEEERW